MDADNGTKAERGRRSPSAPLEEAIGYLSTIQMKRGMGPYGVEPLVDALGHKSTASGTARTKIGTLTHFDLLDRDGNVYRVSSIGKRILLPTSPEDHRQAIADAARAPNLYADILRDHVNRALPQLLPNVLVHKYGVLPSTSQDVAALFRQTMEFAGLLRQGVLRDTPTANTPDEEPPAQSSGSMPARAGGESRPVSGPSVAEVITDALSNLTDYRIPLTKRRSAVLRLPVPIDTSDVERIKKWLDLMTDVIASSDAFGGDTGRS